MSGESTGSAATASACLAMPRRVGCLDCSRLMPAEAFRANKLKNGPHNLSPNVVPL
eukprot:gene22751-27726_t